MNFQLMQVPIIVESGGAVLVENTLSGYSEITIKVL
jgi:hypothetical protein